ncbi:MAG: hypothetical protein K1X79_05405 [Oligoflexia bacterium]|nr:hypothetical protein [Oligoflexia bacterium]
MPTRRLRRSKIRLSNATYLGTSIYKILQELDFVEYGECSPTENARLLQEGSVDVSLIPVTDFAAHGGYVGLDYGLACQCSSQALYLCAHQSPQYLETVYVYEGAGASRHLLQVLLKERWKCSPRMVRVNEPIVLSSMGPKEGALILEHSQLPSRSVLPVQEDLVAVWDSVVAKPVVFLVWAVRPGVLSLRQLEQLRDQLQRGCAAVEPLVRDMAPKFGLSIEQCHKFWSQNYQYYLSAATLEGLNVFFERVARHRLLPKAQYRSATRTLFERRSYGLIRERPLSEVLDAVLDGERLGIHDAVRICRQASLADAGMVADLCRRKLHPTRALREVLFLDPHEGRDLEDAVEAVKSARQRDIRDVLILPTQLSNLEWYEGLLDRLSQSGPLFIEGFTIPQLLQLADKSGLSLSAVVRRLATKGLACVTSYGAGMLTERGLKRRRSTIPLPVWLDSMRSVMGSGVGLSGMMSLNARESWEERLCHLNTIRTLQDEYPSFLNFAIEYLPSRRISMPVSEARLRAYIISRLFLDNVNCLSERTLGAEAFGGVLNLSFGADEVVLSVGPSSIETAAESAQALSQLGMEFRRRSGLRGEQQLLT